MKKVSAIIVFYLTPYLVLAQNVGVGVTNPTLGKFVVRGTVGAVSGIFGDQLAGVSIMNSLPSIGFNYYYSGGNKSISTGFGSAIGLDNNIGRFYITTSATSVTGAGTNMPLIERFVIKANGNIGIAVPDPIATLQVSRGTGVGGTAEFDGTTYSSHFNYNIDEDTYIRGGKVGSDVIVNDQSSGNVRLAEGGGNVGIGLSDPLSPLSFAQTLGKKISLYRGPTGDAGFGVYGNELRMNSDYSGADITFGYDNFTNDFRENMRITGTGNLGIGTYPTAKLDAYTALGETGLKHSWTGGGSLSSIAPTLLTAAKIKSSGAAFQLATDNNIGLYLKLDGNIGVNVNNPTYQLDVKGRMRIRGTAGDGINTAGFYLDGPSSTERGFIGMLNNDKIGLYGSGGAGWSVVMDVNNGNFGIGTTAPNSKLQVSGSVSMPYKTVSDAYTVTDNDYSIRYVPGSAQGPVITLPAAAGRMGRMYIISADLTPETGVFYKQVTIEDNTGTNVIQDNWAYADPHGIQYNALMNIQYNNGATSLPVKRKLSITVQSDGAKWKIIDGDFRF